MSLVAHDFGHYRVGCLRLQERLTAFRYGWMAVLSIITITDSRRLSEMGESGDSWPQWVWIAMSAVTLASCVYAVLPSAHREFGEAFALGAFGFLALSRISCTLASNLGFSETATDIVLWGGGLLAIYAAISLRREGIG